MALNNQPYLPLYVNDWLSNTKLKSCSASAHGIMINIMLLMHKEGDYGKILLKQKFKQTDKQISNFALQFAKVLPFDLLEIEGGLLELFDENILVFDDDFIVCNRMVRDAEISTKRSLSGSKGGFSTQSNNSKRGGKKFAKAKVEANTEYEYEYEIIIENIINYLNNKAETNFKSDTAETQKLIRAKLKKFNQADFEKVVDIKVGQWKNDPVMKGFLRPITLFGSKFESYLNETPVVKLKSGFVR